MNAIQVHEQSDIGEARRQAAVLADVSGLPASDAGRLSIVVSELASNILKHAGRGRMLLRAMDKGVEVIALDNGPGMANPEACIVDGYSTTSTRGEGLGAVQRQTQMMDVYSRAGAGAAILARVTAGPAPVGAAVGGISICYPGEDVCGDAWAVRSTPEGLQLMVADGLGHGLLAHEAAKEAVATFQRWRGDDPAGYLEAAHAALRPTRGAAVAMASLGPTGVAFGGVGNIAGTLISATAPLKRMISHNGTLGHVARRFQRFDYPATPPYLVVMHSDGLGTQWTLDPYPGLAAADPSLIAAVLYRDFTRDRDDVTVVAAKVEAR